jgi:UDP-N-acetylmuramoylalanine--D-glutamate ligase
LRLKKVLLFGIGKTNTELHRALSKDPGVSLWVSSDDPKELVDFPKGQRLKPKEALTQDFDEVYCPPGVPCSHPIFERFQVLNEVEYSSALFSGRIIGVTGSNGKSTVCKLIYDYLSCQGYDCVLAGNYGQPLCSFLDLAPAADFIILELSSFQIFSLREPMLDFAVLTSFEADHLDWHPNLNHYRETKLRIFDLLKPGGRGLIPFELNEAPKNTFSFSFQDAEAALGYVGGGFSFQGRSFTLGNCPSHLRSAYLLLFGLLVLSGSDTEGLRDYKFETLEHRLESVADKSGVLYVNDSKSTTPGATLFALKNIECRQISLMLGGKSKNLALSRFFDQLTEFGPRIHRLYVYGDLANFEAELRRRGFEVNACQKFEDLLKHLGEESDLGDCVMLSPGFSSLDQFSSFEERGESFKAFVQQQ